MECSQVTPIRVMALHALVYCERLFYLEEVEEIRVADARVWAGRTLHEELGETGELLEVTLESEALGIKGKIDAIRSRDGAVFPVEHKRGRSAHDRDGTHVAWETDRVQIAAYAMLLEEHLGGPVAEGRVRYHADERTVRVRIDEPLRATVHAAVARARELAKSSGRPPVTPHEGRCSACSLSPVCLPEETRLAESLGSDTIPPRTAKRLFPADSEARSLHLLSPRARLGRSGEALELRLPDEKPEVVGIRGVSDVVVHGYAQVSTQALRQCAASGVPVHYLNASGNHLGTFASAAGGVQRRIRQFQALGQDEVRLRLARSLVKAKVELQLRHILRASRKSDELRSDVSQPIAQIRDTLPGIARVTSADSLLGYEGSAARAYFAAVAQLVTVPELVPDGRTRRPPADPFNALLSFGYGLLYRDLLSAVLRVGLDPAFGFYHQPRTAAYPLVLDLMELFRVPMVDMLVLGMVNRNAFDGQRDFVRNKAQVWLSDAGRHAFLEMYEKRKDEEYRHPVIGYSLSYARLMELETRLLEKEWSNEPGLFARMRIR
jgi:CRISP-associated protein Cas1